MFYVFDIDGTIADLTHRLPLIQGGKKDWDGFFSACKDDAPIMEVLLLAKTLVNDPHFTVEFWTGRMERCRDDTLSWLRKHGIYITSAELRMRQEGDYRPDYEVKREYLDQIAPVRPFLIFEDRAAVVKMWREEGLQVAHIAEGDY